MALPGNPEQDEASAMPSGPTFVIVGASLGGARAAEALRDEGFDGQIVLIGAEAHHPYERPPLSKGYLQGTEERQSIFVHDDGWYAEHAIDLRLGTAVTAIDRNLRQVALASGETVGYDKLLLTTGAVPVRLPVPGADVNGVLTLRTVDDSERLRETLASASRVAIVGAGWIGLEVAAAARLAGVAVTVIEAAELPLLGVLGREVAQVFLNLHREHDVDVRLSAQVAEILVSADAATGVRLTGETAADGTQISADAVVTGIGVAPATALAEAAGLDVDGGVRTDAALRTSDPVIYAAGDAARAYHPLLGTHLRVEHWSNARHQPVAAARSMLGQDVAYDRLPYFFSDQYDLGMEYSGSVPPGGYDQLVFRGDVGKREFVAFWLSGRRVLAGMNVNIWDVNDQIQELVRAGRPVDPERLADPDIPLAETATAS
jgi:3-phenylpropionate/trans-cinnamate dioxygenase ferredoxin reductase component